MLRIVDLEATRPQEARIRVKANIISLLPPLFPYALGISFDGKEVYRGIRLSSPPVKGMDYFDALFWEAPPGATNTVRVLVTSVLGVVKDQKEISVT